jgi:TatD DNase family protein
MFIDSHCHIDSEPFAGEEDAVLSKMQDAAVDGCLLACCALSEYQRALDFARRHKNVWSSVGIHPSTDAEDGEDADDFISSRAGDPKIVAVGECGLDYFYGPDTRNLQMKRFARQIEAARAVSLPVIVHSRDAESDTMGLLKEGNAGETGFVLHCFTGGVAMARQALDLGGYLSFSGILTFKTAEQIREAASYAPADRILIETDSPYLTPVPHRGKRNDPSYVPLVAKKLAEVRGMSLESLAAVTTDNFFRLFTKADRALLG